MTREELEKQRKQAEEEFRARSKQACEDAIGKDFRIKTDARTTMVGKIVKAEFSRVVIRGRNLIGLFRVTLESGFSCEVKRIPR